MKNLIKLLVVVLVASIIILACVDKSSKDEVGIELKQIVNTELQPNQVSLKGKIGNKPIEMQLEVMDWEKGTVVGKYRYVNIANYLSLMGQVYPYSDSTISALFLEEFDKGQKIGSFYLNYGDWSGDLPLDLNGWWKSKETDNSIGELEQEQEKSLEVRINVSPDEIKLLTVKSIGDFNKLTSPSLTGTYSNKVESYRVYNNPNPWLGLNGGIAKIEEINKDSIRFEVEVSCGYSCHLGQVNGIATKKDSIYELNSNGCIVNISFDSKSVNIKTDPWSACHDLFGWGANGNVNDEFMKISDEVDFDDNEFGYRETRILRI